MGVITGLVVGTVERIGDSELLQAAVRVPSERAGERLAVDIEILSRKILGSVEE